jgi:hypothetical protein
MNTDLRQAWGAGNSPREVVLPILAPAALPPAELGGGGESY